MIFVIPLYTAGVTNSSILFVDSAMLHAKAHRLKHFEDYKAALNKALVEVVDIAMGSFQSLMVVWQASEP